MPPIPGYAHLAQDPGYRGGAPRIAAHGLRVSGIVQMYRAGMTPEAICESYQDLPLGAVFSALAYAADHAQEIEAEIAEEQRDLAEAMKNYVRDPKLQAALERGDVLP
jgi:uncharacterized protein (DUF433 family)